MPFERKGKCVYRKDTGKKKGCSKTVAGAKKYMRALYVHSKDISKEDIYKYGTKDEIKFLKEEMGMMYPWAEVYQKMDKDALFKRVKYCIWAMTFKEADEYEDWKELFDLGKKIYDERFGEGAFAERYNKIPKAFR